MATGGGNKKGKESNTPKVEGITASIVFTGGVLAGATLLYGVKKFYDYITTDATKEKSTAKILDDEEEDVEMHRRRLRAELSNSEHEISLEQEESLMSTSAFSGYSARGPPPTPTPTPTPTPNINIDIVSPQSDVSFLSEGSLHDNLLEYYTRYVDISEHERSRALIVLEDVKESVRYILEELMPGTPVSGMCNFGPSAEGLNVIRPDVYQVVMQLSLDPKIWELVDAGETLLGAYGYQMVKRTHLEFFSRGVSSYDKFLIGEYLSPQKVTAAFLECINRVNNWGSQFHIQSAVIGPSIKLFVSYGEENIVGEETTIAVEIIPGVLLGGVQVLAATHNTSCNAQKPGYSNLWMQSFAEAEYAHLTSWRPSTPPLDNTTLPKSIADDDDPKLKLEDIGENGCHFTCLKLLEAVRLNHPSQLCLLTPYMSRTIIMHLLTIEDGWNQEELSERFLDALKALEEALRTRVLPHYFCPKLNLLGGQDVDTLDRAREFISAIVGNNQFPGLLKMNY